jgi:hypothetical protein
VRAASAAAFSTFLRLVCDAAAPREFQTERCRILRKVAEEHLSCPIARQKIRENSWLRFQQKHCQSVIALASLVYGTSRWETGFIIV